MFFFFVFVKDLRQDETKLNQKKKKESFLFGGCNLLITIWVIFQDCRLIIRICGSEIQGRGLRFKGQVLYGR